MLAINIVSCMCYYGSYGLVFKCNIHCECHMGQVICEVIVFVLYISMLIIERKYRTTAVTDGFVGLGKLITVKETVC